MEQYRDRPAHLEKIAYQQRLLQEDVVHIRAQISRVSTVRLSNTCECVWDTQRRLVGGAIGGRLIVMAGMELIEQSQTEFHVFDTIPYIPFQPLQ